MPGNSQLMACGNIAMIAFHLLRRMVATAHANVYIPLSAVHRVSLRPNFVAKRLLPSVEDLLRYEN